MQLSPDPDLLSGQPEEVFRGVGRFLGEDWRALASVSKRSSRVGYERAEEHRIDLTFWSTKTHVHVVATGNCLRPFHLRYHNDTFRVDEKRGEGDASQWERWIYRGFEGEDTRRWMERGMGTEEEEVLQTEY